MACAVPILVSGDGEMSSIVSDSESGLCAPAGDPAAFADRIIKLRNLPKTALQVMGNNALRYYREHFNKDKLLNRMDAILQEVIVNRGEVN